MAELVVVGNATRDLNRTGLISARRPGGTLLYATLALDALGHEVRPVGTAPLRAYIWLRRAGLDLSGVRLAFPGTQFLNEYDGGQRRQWARRGPKRAVEDGAALGEPDGLLVGPVIGEVPADLTLPEGPPSLLDLQGTVREVGEPNFWGWRSVEVRPDDPELQRTSHVRGSIEEVGPLTGTETPEDAVAALRERTDAVAVVTMGAQGAVAHDGTLHRAAADPVDIDDPTGAGDVFDAGLLHGIVTGMELGEALGFACETAALFLERAETHKPRERFPSLSAVQERLPA